MSDEGFHEVAGNEVRRRMKDALEFATVKLHVACCNDEERSLGTGNRHGFGNSRGYDADLACGELYRGARTGKVVNAVGKSALREPGGGCFKRQFRTLREKEILKSLILQIQTLILMAGKRHKHFKPG